ncbi:hypothetical protein F1880_006997 [Penicillium rolfsii]|nr:hypothetical protein F1880_006997 [Penicillium rolfsii]
MTVRRPFGFPTVLRPLRTNAARQPRPLSRRTLSTPPTSSQAPKPAQASPKGSLSRLRRFNDRLPRFLRTYTTPLLGAPVTHVTSFLVLHEITAIVPLLGLVAAFHYGAWMPDLSSDSDSRESNAFDEGAKRFGRWLRKRGWVEEYEVNAVAEHEVVHKERAGVRLVLEFATAYAITKALLPFRIAASVWATPWFARTILTPATNTARRLFGKN